MKKSYIVLSLGAVFLAVGVVFALTYSSHSNNQDSQSSIQTEVSETLSDEIMNNITASTPTDDSSVEKPEGVDESEITDPDMLPDPNEGFSYKPSEDETGEIVDVTQDELYKQEWVGDHDIMYLLTDLQLPIEEAEFRKQDPNHYYSFYTIVDTDGTYEKFIRKYLDIVQEKINKIHNTTYHYTLSKQMHGQYPEGEYDLPNQDLYILIWEE